MFRPIHENNAIQTVHFAVETTDLWLERDQEVIQAGAKEWKAVLPMENVVTPMLTVQTGTTVTGPGQPASLRPMNIVAYGRSMPNGTVEWELVFQGNAIQITTRSYSRWEHTWGVAERLLEAVGRALKDRSTEIKTAELTYQDVFVWDGRSEKYNLEELVTTDEGLVGREIKEKGKLWHWQMGWIMDQTNDSPAQWLERIHLAGVRGPTPKGPRHMVTIETTTRAGHGSEQPLFTLQKGFRKIRAVENEGPAGSIVFEWMHRRCKDMIGRILKQEIQDRIGLWRT